jgi:hypothetical protein
LKAVVRDVLGLAPNTPIVIHEAACTEEGCAPVETLIGVLDGSERTFRLTRPLSDVTPADVRALLSSRSSHDHDH